MTGKDEASLGMCCLCLSVRVAAVLSRLSCVHRAINTPRRLFLSCEQGERLSRRAYSSGYCLNKSYVISLKGGQEVNPCNPAGAARVFKKHVSILPGAAQGHT